MASADRAGGILLLLFAAFVTARAREMPYWMTNAPGPGFLPFWLGVMLGGASLLMIGATLFRRTGPLPSTAEQPAAEVTRVAVVVGLTAGAAALALAVGLVLASGVFMIATLAYLRPGRMTANLAAGLITPLVVWLLFVRWLAVPLPAGPFGF